MHRTFLAAAVVGLAGLASAGGPTDFISYQGQLKDDGALANGDYEFSFGLWAVGSSGPATLADSVMLTLNVENGLFNADLPFSDDFGDYTAFGFAEVYELEIGARPAGSMDPFTVLPRQPVRNAPRATYAERGSDTFGIGDADGGRLEVLDGTGAVGFVAEPDFSGDGQFVSVSGANGNIFLDGTSGSTGPRLTINGIGDSIILEPGAPVVDNKVILPPSSIGSAEIGDEPGVASASSSPFSSFLTTSYQSLLTRSIMCPADGYVLVNGLVGLGTTGSSVTAFNEAAISIDGTTPYNSFSHGTFISLSNNNTQTFGLSVPLAQVIPVTAGQTLDVSIIARTDNGSAGYYTQPLQLTLHYVPTSYGTVSERVPPIGTPNTGTPGMLPPAPGTGFMPTGVTSPDVLPNAEILAKQRELEAKLDMVLLELEATKRAQAEANGR